MAGFSQGVSRARRWLRKERPPRAVLCGLAAMVLSVSVYAGPARADAITLWNTEMLDLIRGTSRLLVSGPPIDARDIAILGTSMFDAVNAAQGASLPSFIYSGGPVPGASADAAALASGYHALTTMFAAPVWSDPVGGDAALINGTILPRIATTYGTALAALYAGAGGDAGKIEAIDKGLLLGQAAATSVAAARASDGSAKAVIDGLTPYVPPGSGTVPGVYVPPATRPAMLPTWGDLLEPFGVTRAQRDAIKASAPHTFPSFGSEAYAKGLLETQCMGFSTGTPLSAGAAAACAAAGFSGRTDAQVNAALFWNDPGTSMHPPGHWLQIATTIMNDRNLSLLDKARLTALLGQGMSDAGAMAWDIKYDLDTWRPITAIRTCETDTAAGTVSWNPFFTTCDTDWQSLIATPPHPDYVAGHPAFSAAAATIIAGFIRTDDVSFCSTSDAYINGTLGPVPEITMCFDKLSDANGGPLGATYSRVLGGIHTPFAVNDAEDIGRMIANQILWNNQIPEPGTLALVGLSVAVLGGLRRLRRRR